MAKNRTAKERARAKQRRVSRQSQITKRASQRRELQLAIEQPYTARSVALRASTLISNIRAGKSPFIPEPAQYAEMLDFLKARGGKEVIDALARQLLERHAFDEGCPPGVAFVYRAGESAPVMEAIPASLWFLVDDFKQYLLSTMKRLGGQMCFWLVWEEIEGESFVPLVIAVREGGELALWYLDPGQSWYPATSEEEFRRKVDNLRPDEGDLVGELGYCDPLLWRLLYEAEALNVEQATTIRNDDPRLKAAVDSLTMTQSSILGMFAGLSCDAAAYERQADKLLDEIDLIDRQRADLEKQVARQTRALEEANRKLAMTQAAVTTSSRAEPSGVQPVLSLAARLARVF